MRLNRFLLVLITAMIVLILQIPVSCAAEIIESGQCGWDITWTVDRNGLMTISGEGDMWDDVVAENVLDPIIGEAESYVWLTQRVTEIIIEDGVESIGESAFTAYSNLKNITIPNSVKTIKKNVFDSCNALESIYIPAGVTSIHPLAFQDCTSLARINVSGQNTLYKSLNGMLVSKDGKTIHYCPSAIANIENFKVPNGIEIIGDYAFYKHHNLKTITFPSTLTTILDNSFEWCTKLRTVTIPDSVTHIGHRAFSSCPMLKTITIPGSVKELGWYVFASCEALETVTFLHGVTEIPNYGFFGSAKLKTVYIPATVKSINDDAFYECYDLTDVYYGGSEYDWNNINKKGDYYSLLNANMHYNYFVGEPNFILPSSLQRIESKAYYGIINGVFRLPGNISYIASDAFDTTAVLLVPSGSTTESKVRQLNVTVVGE